MKIKTVETALTVAGSDSSGGAGIQADLKTFAALEVFGTSVVTSITSQNTLGVEDTFDLPLEVVTSQLKAVFDDQKPAAVKTGMLGNAALVDCVARAMKRHRVKRLVVDPVIMSTSRKVLLNPAGVQALKEKLLPLALLVTPNLPEAETLTSVRIRKPADRMKAARVLIKTGVKNVLIKGGHAQGAPEDFFFDGRASWTLSAERWGKEDLHGTGCVLSAAVTARLAQGVDLPAAVREAKEFITRVIPKGVRSGKGNLSVEPLAGLYEDRERWDLFRRVSAAVERLKESKIGDLIPEVQSNIGVGLEGARNWEDVIAVPGRLIKKGREVVTLDAPAFGASRHVANIVLTVMRFDPSKRAVMNIKLTDSLLSACRRQKWNIATFSRADEPRRVKEKEGSSLEWGTAKAIERCGRVPDIIFDRGGMGKEEMIRVIAPDVESLVDRVLRLHRLVS